MMTRTVRIECGVMLLLGQIIFLIITQVAADRNILETTVVNENDEEISLRWVETEPLLANENLPIWLTTTLPDYVERDLNVMKQIGKFRTYHDLEKSSAIILIEQWNCIYGIIDVRYTIICLPLDQLRHRKHKIGQSQNVIKLGNARLHSHEILNDPATPPVYRGASTSNAEIDDFNMLIETLVNDSPSTSRHRDCPIRRTVIQHTSSDQGPPPNKLRRMQYHYEKQVITVYPEVLIFISNEIVRSAKHLVTIVLRYLVDFNMVAMFFAKLATHNVKIHINIAGLVIEKNRVQFPFTPLFEDTHPSGSSVLTSIIEYIKRVESISDPRHPHRILFSDDSFDMFLFSTMKEWQELGTKSGGISTSVFDLRKNRRIRPPLSAKVFLGSLVDAGNIMQHHLNAVREIAHLMTVENDGPSNLDWCSNEDQCHAIMQSNGYCPSCLKWSPESVNSLKKFLSTHHNRCFFRNIPRSLHPYDHPIKTLVPADQCLCHGHKPDSEITHLNADGASCRRMLRCLDRETGLRPRSTPLPVDGTPCDERNEDRVCWDQRCTSTQL